MLKWLKLQEKLLCVVDLYCTRFFRVFPPTNSNYSILSFQEGAELTIGKYVKLSHVIHVECLKMSLFTLGLFKITDHHCAIVIFLSPSIVDQEWQMSSNPIDCVTGLQSEATAKSVECVMMMIGDNEATKCTFCDWINKALSDGNCIVRSGTKWQLSSFARKWINFETLPTSFYLRFHNVSRDIREIS